MNDKVRGYAHRVDIAADVQRVWQALIGSEHLARWCSPGARISARPGGSFRASVDRLVELEAHIDLFEPARRMRLIYLPAPGLPPTQNAIVDDFMLDMKSTDTIVRLLGSGIPGTSDWDVPYRRLRFGWQQALTRLKVLVEKQMKGQTS